MTMKVVLLYNIFGIKFHVLFFFLQFWTSYFLTFNLINIMKKLTFLLSVLFLSTVVFGQGIDFSGKWKLNASKSKLGEQFSMAPKEIVITQSGNNMSVEKHSSFQDQEMVTNSKYTLDGKECVNTGFMESQNKSTAVWSDDKKSLKVTTKFQMGDQGDGSFVEVYKLDGANLSIVTTTSFGDTSETGVYDKQ